MNLVMGLIIYKSQQFALIDNDIQFSVFGKQDKLAEWL